jgi:hypothetical protein
MNLKPVFSHKHVTKYAKGPLNSVNCLTMEASGAVSQLELTESLRQLSISYPSLSGIRCVLFPGYETVALPFHGFERVKGNSASGLNVHLRITI